MSQLSHIKNAEKGKLLFFGNACTTFELQTLLFVLVKVLLYCYLTLDWVLIL